MIRLTPMGYLHVFPRQCVLRRASRLGSLQGLKSLLLSCFHNLNPDSKRWPFVLELDKIQRLGERFRVTYSRKRGLSQLEASESVNMALSCNKSVKAVKSQA